MDKNALAGELSRRKGNFDLGIWSRSVPDSQLKEPNRNPPNVYWKQMPHDPIQCAHVLFAQLRDFDALGVQQIWVEIPPAESAWEGIFDRLRRAETTDR